jgi:hypothetical protein
MIEVRAAIPCGEVYDQFFMMGVRAKSDVSARILGLLYGEYFTIAAMAPACTSLGKA